MTTMAGEPVLNDLRLLLGIERGPLVVRVAVAIGIVAGDDLSENELREFAGRYKLSFPVLLDHDFSLTNFFGATKTIHNALQGSPQGLTPEQE